MVGGDTGNSRVLERAKAFLATTSRWSATPERKHITGTEWYGMMCRSFLLLETMLRDAVERISASADDGARAAAAKRAAGRGVSSMTLGQLIGFADELASRLGNVSSSKTGEISRAEELFRPSDREAWNRILALRNEMAHHGPGFLDSVDLKAGRIWRRYNEGSPRMEQAAEVFRLGRLLCRSPLILKAVLMEGGNLVEAQEQLNGAECSNLTLSDIGRFSEEAINEFHRHASEVGD